MTVSAGNSGTQGQYATGAPSLGEDVITDPTDERIGQFIQSLRLNQYTYPEVGASCVP